MKNAVLDGKAGENPFLERSARRALAHREAALRAEAQRLIESTRRVMRRTGSIEPRVGEIVAEAGLSNQAFYRHFESKDELLLAVLMDGYEQLLNYIESRDAEESRPLDKVRSWIRCTLVQAAHPEAAAATRPFAANASRLVAKFPEESSLSTARLRAPLLRAIEAALAAGEAQSPEPERDADAIYHMAMGWMERKIIEGEQPQREDIEHVVNFAVRGLARENTHGT